MKTGWHGESQYFVVKPLKNGHRQSLIMGVDRGEFGRWYVMMGVFRYNISYENMLRSDVWRKPTSTNESPSAKVFSLALEALDEIEQEIHNHANGKRAYIYVDGMDARRLRVYTKVLTKKSGYKKSTAKSDYCGLPLIYKKV